MHIRFPIVPLLALIFLASVVGCAASDDGGGSSTFTGEIATFTVTNNSSSTIMFIYVSPIDDMDWGDDILEDDVLAPGESGTVLVMAGQWDVKCVSDEGDELILGDVTFDGDTELNIVGDSDDDGDSGEIASLSVENQSSQTIMYVFISPVSEMMWGEDVLEDEVLEPGEGGTILVMAGRWDIRCITDEDEELIFEDVMLDGDHGLVIFDD